jgi:hypothetical protein
MKTKILVLLALCIILSSSMAVDTIRPLPTNVSKKPTPSTPSTDGDTSSDSIDSFSESIVTDDALDPDTDTNGDFSKAEWGSAESVPDDIMLRPDGEYIVDYVTAGDPFIFTGETSSSGTASTTFTSDDDCLYAYTSSGPTDMQIAWYMSVTDLLSNHPYWAKLELNVEAHYKCDNVADDTAELQFYNNTSSAWEKIDDLTRDTTSPYNDGGVLITVANITNDYWNSSGYINLQLDLVDSDDDIIGYVDYIRLNCYEMDLVDSNHYGESFSYVNDWAGLSTEGLDAITTNGDVATLLSEDNGNADYFIVDITDSEFDYFELSASYNISGSAVSAIDFRTDAGASLHSATIQYGGQDSWMITKGCIRGIGTVGKIYIYMNPTAYGDYELKMDYLRLYPQDEGGWQHDASDTSSTSPSADCSITSDGDKWTISATTDNRYVTVYLDDTVTTAIMDVDYYSFVEASITTATNSDADSWVWGFRFIGTSGTEYTDAESTTGVFRYNLGELGIGDITSLQIWPDSGDTVIVDYVKIYTLVNWTENDAAGNDPINSAVYYDTDALVFDMELTSGEDYQGLRAENITSHWPVTDCVVGFTAKASANNAMRIRFRLEESGGVNTDEYYYLATTYQTFWMPLDADESYPSFEYIWFWVYDYSTTSPTGNYQAYIMDNITIRPSWYDASTETGTYSESFSDVSEWSEYGTGEIESYDGDVITMAGDAWGHVYSTLVSFSDLNNMYVEMRVRANKTINFRLFGWQSNTAPTGPYSFYTDFVNIGTDWQTFRYYVHSTQGFTSDTCETLSFASGNDDWALYVDYVRIAPSTDIGYQYDGSSMALTLGADAYAVATNGDKLYMGAKTDARYAQLSIPETVDVDYYPFFEAAISGVVDGDTDSKVWLFEMVGTSGNAYTTPSPYYNYGEGIHRANVNALDIGDITAVRIYVEDADDAYQIDYLKFYTIANFTYSHTSAQYDEYFYVDNNELYVEKSIAGAITLHHDPYISVDASTYSVVNATLSGTYDYFVLARQSDYFYILDGETRGAMPSGTLTDFYLKFGGNYDIVFRALTFIEDTNAPSIIQFWTSPYTITENDNVTLAIYATDTLDVYSVSFNAIDCPATFSDVDYDAVESTEQEGLFSYSFGTGDLPAGYYSILATISDGANIATDVIVFRVLSVYLSIQDVVLITATDSIAQMSGYSNKDCSYSVYENESLVGSGSVSEGWFSISWQKNSTAGAYIELGVKFYVSPYTEWVNGSYSVAEASEFAINTWDIDWQDYYVYVTWATTAGNSSIVPYEDGSPASGTTEANTLQYLKSTIEGNHTLDFKVYSGSNVLWKNYTYTISVTTTVSDMHFAFFDTSNNWVAFETLNATITYSGNSYVMSAPVASVPTGVSFTLEVRGSWGELLYNSTFNYTQYKRITLSVYECIIENESDHPVRIDMSYNGTYPNITIIVPTRYFSRLYIPSANYTIMFTYYIDTFNDGTIVNYDELTGYYVSYSVEISGISYFKYTGIALTDIDYNIDYTRTNINQNVDTVDTNVLAIPYPPAVPTNIVTPEMLWLVALVFVAVSVLFAIGGHGIKGWQIARKARVFFKGNGATKDDSYREESPP